MNRTKFKLNGTMVEVEHTDDATVLWTLRDKLGITGPKYGCGVGICGACTSHVNDEAFRPCIASVPDVRGKRVTTIEGLADGDDLHPVQQAWVDLDVAQCGFCQPGQIMGAVALLRDIPNPTDADIDRVMSEHVCRCGTYTKIRAAIKRAAGMT